MNSLNISKEQLSLCHKETCVKINGNMAKTIVFSLAAIVLINGISSMLESSN